MKNINTQCTVLYQLSHIKIDLTLSLIHRVAFALPEAFQGCWLVSVGHKCRQKLRGVSSDPQKSYSELDRCWPPAAGGRSSSHINIMPFFGISTAVTVVTVGVTAGGGRVTAEGSARVVDGSHFASRPKSIRMTGAHYRSSSLTVGTSKWVENTVKHVK